MHSECVNYNNIWKKNNKIRTKFPGTNDRSISKSKLENLVRTLSN